MSGVNAIDAMNRRALLRLLLHGANGALAASLLGSSSARAMGRTPYGGRVVMHVPWLGAVTASSASSASIDPHDLRDPMAAFFGNVVADPLYALDASGQPYPTLAASMPAREAGETVVHLREGLRSARGHAIDNRDVVFSVDRARGRGGYAVLADLPKPTPRRNTPLGVSFGGADPLHVARALASPLVALLPRRWTPAAPDGTGAFRADVSPSGITLTRNAYAARGAAFLDAVEIGPAEDLKTSLRAFEAEQDDIGWLGMGLHDGRRGAVRFDLGRAAWAVLTVGPDAGPASTPGAAQRLVDAIPQARLAHLGLGATSTTEAVTGDAAWAGPPTEALVDESSPHLIEVARAVASTLSNPGHEVTVHPLARAEIARRKAQGKGTLAVELVRSLGPGAHHAQMALASAEDPARGRDIARAPLHVAATTPARALTGLLRVGVIGEIRLHGGVVPDLVLARAASGEGWDLGASYRRTAKRS